MAAAKPRAVERLEEIKNPQKRRAGQADAILKTPDTVSMVLEKTSALTKSFAPKNEADANKLKNHLASAGFRSDGLVPVFYGLKFALLVFGFFVGGGALLWAKGFSQNTLIWVAGVTALCFWLPDIVLGYLAEPAAGGLPGPARRAGHDGRVRRGRPGPGPGDAQGERGDEERLPGPGGRVHLDELPLADGPHAGRVPARSGRADRRGRPAGPGRRA